MSAVMLSQRAYSAVSAFVKADRPRDERGASFTEYVVLLAIIVAIIVAVIGTGLGEALTNKVNDVIGNVNSAGGAGGTDG